MWLYSRNLSAGFGKSINYGSLLEQCWRGANEIPLKDGGVRKFIRDGDNVVMRGHCQARLCFNNPQPLQPLKNVKHDNFLHSPDRDA